MSRMRQAQKQAHADRPPSPLRMICRLRSSFCGMRGAARRARAGPTVQAAAASRSGGHLRLPQPAGAVLRWKEIRISEEIRTRAFRSCGYWLGCGRHAAVVKLRPQTVCVKSSAEHDAVNARPYT
eukprot:4386694-Pleurochrysis_carterae.AAC.1